MTNGSSTELILREGAAEQAVAKYSSFAPKTFQEALKFAEMVSASDLAPKDFRGKPANVLVALQMGMELGLAPMQAIQNIAVINGRPCLWGDALLGIVQSNPNYEWHREWIEGQGEGMAAFCEVKRRGSPEPHRGQFTVAQAKRAKLWGKDSPWSTYPERMLQMRARAFALRDGFADALRGMIPAEEAIDMPPDETSKKRGRSSTIVKSEVIEKQRLAAPSAGNEDSNPKPSEAETEQPMCPDDGTERLPDNVRECHVNGVTVTKGRSGQPFAKAETTDGTFHALDSAMIQKLGLAEGQDVRIEFKSETYGKNTFRVVKDIDFIAPRKNDEPKDSLFAGAQ